MVAFRLVRPRSLPVTVTGPERGEPPTTLPGPSALWGIVVGGGLVGLAVVWTAGNRSHEAWLVWAVFAAALTGTAALTGIIGWRSWDLVSWAHQPAERPKRHLLIDLSLVALLVATVMGIGIACRSTLRGEMLVAATLLGGAPAVAAMTEACRMLREPRGEGALGNPPFDAIAEIRLLLRRLLVAGGALVALSTLALGAALDLPQAGSASQCGEPNVLVFGALGSSLVGLFYVPAAAALRARIREEVRDRFPLDNADVSGKQIVQRLKGRREFEKLLAGDQGIYDELLASIVVLGPLLTSAVQQYVVR